MQVWVRLKEDNGENHNHDRNMRKKGKIKAVLP